MYIPGGAKKMIIVRDFEKASISRNRSLNFRGFTKSATIFTCTYKDDRIITLFSTIILCFICCHHIRFKIYQLKRSCVRSVFIKFKMVLSLLN